MGRRHRKGRALHGLLLLDKPAGESSNRSLQRVKRLFGAAKAGHTGTLDPLATGMLPIMFGEATKLGGYLIDADKAYATTLRLGISTDTLDADGTPVATRPVPAGLDAAAIEALLDDFRGERMQVPPMVSAISVGGRRLYQLAREGIVIEREPRRVTLHEIELLDIDVDVREGEGAVHVGLAVRCSKGTYIRSLAHDIGERLGCGAHVTRLRRTWVAPFVDAPMITLDELEALADGEARDARLLPLDAGLAHLGRAVLDAEAMADFRHGRKARTESIAITTDAGRAADAALRVFGPDGTFAGLATPDAEDPESIRPLKVLQLGDPG